MADITFAQLKKPIYSGAHGNMSIKQLDESVNGLTSADRILFATLPVGTTLREVHLKNTYSSGSANTEVGIAYNDGTEVALVTKPTGGTDFVSAVSINTYISDNNPAYLYYKSDSSSPITGAFQVKIKFNATGY